MYSQSVGWRHQDVAGARVHDSLLATQTNVLAIDCCVINCDLPEPCVVGYAVDPIQIAGEAVLVDFAQIQLAVIQTVFGS